MKQVFNTGKVRIGAMYTPPAPLPDADAERLQVALLDGTRSMDPEDKAMLIGCSVIGVVFLAMVVASWLPGSGA